MAMAERKITLPDDLKHFVDEQVATRGFASASDSVAALIGKDRDRQHLRCALLAGAQSQVVATADEAYFAGLRARAGGQRRNS